MMRFCFTVAMGLALPMTFAAAQGAGSNPGRVLAPPAPSGAAAPGEVVHTPSGGIGVTTGGTSSYQTFATPGGSGTLTPGAGGTSTAAGPGTQAGTVATPR